MKKLNRNAFNEKLIHRYLLERYYFSSKSERNKLLPEKFHKKEINLIVPEEAKVGDNYRADLTLYFKGSDKGIPVEVKWFEQSLSKKNQIDYLNNNNGFVVSFKGNNKGSIVEHITIDHSDFSKWVSGNISKLTRESLVYQAKVGEASSGNQNWIVYLRGTSHPNFRKMLAQSSNNPFWAFKQNKHSLKNILDMQIGDSCLFILGYAKEGMGMSNNPNLKFEYTAWYETLIKEPHYMELTGDKGTFFERGTIPVNERRWPHFVDFEIIDKHESDERLTFGKRGELADVFAESVNYGAGAPAPLTRIKWEFLIDRFRSIRS